MKKITTFWRVTDDQYTQIQQQLASIETNYIQAWSKRYEEEAEIKAEKDSVCPLCGCKTIVNNIRDTKGTINGGFFSSYSNVRTEPVNHCSECGNEWHKYEIHIGGNDKWWHVDCIIKLLYGEDFNIESIPENLKLTTPLYAETVLLFIQDNHHRYFEYPSGLWRRIRKYFPSVKDKSVQSNN